MLRFEVGDVRFSDSWTAWRVTNSPGVQAVLQSEAQRGLGIAKALASAHVRTGELMSGISLGASKFTATAGPPVDDWLITFEHPWIKAIEYGHHVGGMFEGKKAKRAKGIFLAHRTFKAMGGR